MTYYCCDQRRLEVVKLQGTLNGLEYLEVLDSGIAGDPTRQLTLFVKFLRPVPPLLKDNLRIDGGDRIKTIAIEWVATANALPATEPPSLVDGLTALDEFLVIRTVYYGDFSRYTLHLVSGPGSDTPPAGFDPTLSSIQFSFKVQCASDFDCLDPTPCPRPPAVNPRLDYLTKDYPSFRRLMLDRMSVLMPGWQSRSPADEGIALVELLAYVGDQLSYQQDAVATEAYLGTARRRTSLRRHGRLVDYRVHEGDNARAWVRVFVNDNAVQIAGGTPLLTRVPNLPDRLAPGGPEWSEALRTGALVFQTVEETLLYQGHERFSFYTWGERECCLPKNATKATLRGEWPNLKAGDVLVFVEERSPRTGEGEDADRANRWAVRLTDVRPSQDSSGGLFSAVPNNNPVKVTEIRWAESDALPFPLCVSTITDEDHGSTYLPEVSGAYGNIVLADHGRTISQEDLGAVPPSGVAFPNPSQVLTCTRSPLTPIAPRFRPRLRERPLTHSLPLSSTPLFEVAATQSILNALQAHSYDPALHDALVGQNVVLQSGPVTIQGGDGLWSVSDGSNAIRLRVLSAQLLGYPLGAAATLVTAADPSRARPAITLKEQLQGTEWVPCPDLLGSAPEAREFVVESEHDGSAIIRFGDDYHGQRPNSGTAFTATYRIGNGVAGNIGLESLAHIVTNDARLLRISNPLPARGGMDPESAEDIRRDAPEAFRVQERAVTEADYGEVTQRHPSVQRAAATFRWTGSWHTVFLSVDRKGGAGVDAAYEQTMLEHVGRYRMAGYDLEVDNPRYVPLELEMTVCVDPNHFRADVRSALTRVFSRGWLLDGTRALFHPDNFTFGQPVYLSTLYQAAQSVQGVASVEITVFQRLRSPDTKPLDEGVLKMGRLEVARLDNDPNFPERGVVRFSIGGGK